MVLGSPADGDGNPTPTELERVTEAVREYERGVAPRMIFTGGAGGNGFVEARVMARVPRRRGFRRRRSKRSRRRGTRWSKRAIRCG